MKSLSTITSDGIILNGDLHQTENMDVAYIYLHGYMDKATNKIGQAILHNCIENNISILLPELRGTENINTFKTKDGSDITLGSYYERIEDAHLDISAWIKVLKSLGYSNFVLIGHSLGTIKSVRYLFEGEYSSLIQKLVLLSPYDKNGYLEARHPKEWKEWVNECKKSVELGLGSEKTPEYFDDDEMSKSTYYSWYNESDLSCIFDFYRKDYEFPILNKINIPVHIIVGENDEFFFMKSLNKDINEVIDILKKNIKKLSIDIVKKGGHLFEDQEDYVSKLIFKLKY